MTTHAKPPTSSEGTRATGLGSVVSAETIKLWSLTTQRALLLVAVGLAGLAAAFFYLTLPLTQGRTLAALEPGEILEAGVLGVDAAAIVVIVFAAFHVGAEYSTGLIQTTLTLTPSRRRVVAGKLVTAGLAALCVGIAAAALCLIAAVVAGATVGLSAGEILTGEGVRLAAGSLAMPVVYAVIAAAGAFVFRSTASGIVTPLFVMAVGGLAGLLGGPVGTIVTPLMPVAAIHSLAGTATGHEAISTAAAVGSLIVWIGLSAGAATWRLVRRDA